MLRKTTSTGTVTVSNWSSSLPLGKRKLAQISGGADRSVRKVRSGAFVQARDLSLEVSVGGPVLKWTRVGRVAGADRGPGNAVATEADLEKVSSAVALDGLVSIHPLILSKNGWPDSKQALTHVVSMTGQGKTSIGGGGKSVTGGGASGRIMPAGPAWRRSAFAE